MFIIYALFLQKSTEICYNNKTFVFYLLFIYFMAVTPVGNYVLVEIIKEETKTQSGLIIQEKENRPIIKGKVIDIGEGEEYADGTKYKFAVNKGDTVFYKMFSGNDIEVESKQMCLVLEKEIIAKIK